MMRFTNGFTYVNVRFVMLSDWRSFYHTQNCSVCSV